MSVNCVAAVDIYAGVASSLAEKKKGGQLADFLKNIKNNVNHDDWDQVCPSSYAYCLPFLS